MKSRTRAVSDDPRLPVGRLLQWFDKAKRAMPWRDDPRPYPVWVSEIMLQQTQVATVIPYFQRFLRRFPSVRALAKADIQEVLKLWEGLGYYSRCRNLHHAAGLVVASHGGRLPATADSLRELPGIGAYTAAAIASICHHEPVPVVDGNVIRVFTRFLGITADSRTPAVRRRIEEFLARYIPARRPGDFNQAIMELGALVCRPRNPACDACPLKSGGCNAFESGRTGTIPVKRRAHAVPEYEIGVGVIRRRGRILIARRPADSMLGGLWEFPGGKRRPGEDLADTVRREIREECGLEVKVGDRLCMVRHAYSHFKVIIHAFDCVSMAGRARPLASDELRWVKLGELTDHPFPTANRWILSAMK